MFCWAPITLSDRLCMTGIMPQLDADGTKNVKENFYFDDLLYSAKFLLCLKALEPG